MSKNNYLKGFGIVVIVLALVRCVFPSIALKADAVTEEDKVKQPTEQKEQTEQAEQTMQPEKIKQKEQTKQTALTRDDTKTKRQGVHPIVGVLSYSEAFPDSNDVQLETAKRLGVQAVSDRQEAEQRKNELVYMAASPYYHVDRLKSSIPYLVPRAAVLLNDLGRHFFDSLYVKGIPLHKMVVTSVLRSQEDLQQLKTKNFNVSENSCHLYGTTFDIAYNRYKTVSDPFGPQRREVSNDTLKWVLSEVVRDMRKQGRCFVKYEVKQGCFHITVR
ncbi:MAG: hypothetical protein J5529_07635 [Prevotella sp.]|nr:hypothetical protein [Prevotella sp.]